MYFLKHAVTLSVVAACVYAPVRLHAQQPGCDNTLYLRIADKKTGETIPGATVGVAVISSMSDENGLAALDSVCGGILHLHIQAVGYLTYDGDVRYTSDTLDIKLAQGGITLDDVEVQGHKQTLATTTTVTTLHEEDLDKLKGGNLAGMISTVPGVRILQTGATIGKPVVDGMHSNRLLILNNGIRQEGQQWGSEHAPEIDPFIAQSITVIKGAEAIRYGAEAIGGVVLVNPPALPADSSIHAEINLTGASNGRTGAASAMMSGNFKKIPALAWRIQGTARRGGNYRTADYYLDNTGSRELNYSAAAGYTKAHFDADIFYSHFNSEIGIFKGSHIGSREDLLARIANGRPFDNGSFYDSISAPKQVIKHDLLKATVHFHLNDYLHANVRYGFQLDNRQEYDIRRGGRTSLPSLNYNLYTQTLDASVEYFNGNQFKAEAGVNGLYQQNKKVDGTATRPLIPNFNTEGAGVYATGRIMKPGYELEAGVRYDYKYLSALGYRGDTLYGGRHTFHNISASIGGIWHASHDLEMRSNIGTAWRPPTVNELYSGGLHHGAGAVEYGDSTLASEKSIKWITSANYRKGHWLTVDMDVYAHYFSNYIYLFPTGTFSESLRGDFPVFQTTQDNARFLGADFSANARFLKYLDYTLKGSFIRAKNLTLNNYLPMIPADRIEQILRFQYEHVAFLQKSYVQLGHVFVAKQTRYDPGSDFAPPPDAYHLFNLGIGSQLIVGGHTLDINCSVDNLGNALYKDYMNRFRYYAHDIGRSFIVRLTYRI